MPGSAVVDIRNTYGAAFVGLIVSQMLFGLEIAQAWIYYWQYWNKDRKALKFLVAFLIVMDTMSTIMSTCAIYWYLVGNFNNVEGLGFRVWFINLQPFFSAITIPIVQLFYVRRAYLVSGSLLCPIIVVPLCIGSTVWALYSILSTISGNTGSQSEGHVPVWLPTMWSSLCVFVMLLVTATICWTLHRKRTGFAKTDSMIITLMVNSINSGVLLCAIEIAMAITFAINPSNMIWLAIYWVENKCFINSLIAMLNIRDYVRDRGQLTTDVPENLSSIRFDSFEPSSGSKSGQPGVTVTVHHSTLGSTASDDSRANSGTLQSKI